MNGHRFTFKSIDGGVCIQQGLITANAGQQMVFMPSSGNGMFIQQPQQTIIQYVPVPVHTQAQMIRHPPI
jgi:hypothetical protein